MRTRMPALLCAALLALPLAGPVVASDLEFGQALGIARVAAYGRRPLYADPVALAIASGEWAPPTAGDTIVGPDGGTRTWEAVSMDADGWIRGREVMGGYAWVPVIAEADCVKILQAQGHFGLFAAHAVINKEAKGVAGVCPLKISHEGYF